MQRVYTFMERVHPLPVLLVLGFLAALAWTQWPAWWWFEVAKVQVANARYTMEIPMEVDRVIRRPFQGAWLVTVRRWTDKGWEAHCNAAGTSNYRPDAQLPEKLTLLWWTDGVCNTMPVGKYVVDTSWRINSAQIVRNSSNIFEVTP